MKFTRLHYRKPLHGLLAALLVSATGSTYATTLLPPVYIQGAVSYMSGGVGHDEAMAIKAVARHYPLMLEFVGPKANGHREFLAGENVVINDHRGNTVLHTVSEGPYLLARLPSGKYEVVATDNGISEFRWVTIKPNMEKEVVFTWNHPYQPYSMGG